MTGPVPAKSSAPCRFGGFTLFGQSPARFFRYPMARMHSLRGRRARALPALIAALAFLLGSNYCLLVALGGRTPMACMGVPAVGSAAAMPSCHHAAPATGEHSKKPAAKPSCCPDPVVAPASPVIEKTDLASSPIAQAALAACVEPAAPASIERHGHRPSPDDRPPTRLARAPVPARAPPLA